jgi:hypothetical protein
MRKVCVMGLTALIERTLHHPKSEGYWFAGSGCPTGVPRDPEYRPSKANPRAHASAVHRIRCAVDADSLRRALSRVSKCNADEQ